MKLFDLHCDTAGECFKQKIPLKSNNLHIDLCKGESLDEWMQVFAIWIPDELRGEAALEYFRAVYENFNKEIRLNADKIKLCQGFSDIDSEKNRPFAELCSPAKVLLLLLSRAELSWRKVTV